MTNRIADLSDPPHACISLSDVGIFELKPGRTFKRCQPYFTLGRFRFYSGNPAQSLFPSLNTNSRKTFHRDIWAFNRI